MGRRIFGDAKMRFETTDFITWRLWFRHIAEQGTPFKFWAGSYFKDGKLIYYIQASREDLT